MYMDLPGAGELHALTVGFSDKGDLDLAGS